VRKKKGTVTFREAAPKETASERLAHHHDLVPQGACFLMATLSGGSEKLYEPNSFVKSLTF
jgi:hypothetical protein